MLITNKIDFLENRGGKRDSLNRQKQKTQKELLMLDEPGNNSRPREEIIVMLGIKEIKYIMGGDYEQEKNRLRVSQYQMIMNSSNKYDIEEYIFALPRNNDSMFTIIINPYTNDYELWTIEGEEVERFSDEFWEN